MGVYRVGISGWTYAPWRGTFFPRGLVQKQELAFASRQVNSIEINGSFYSVQTPSSYLTWYEQTPDKFVFAVKGSRFITHMKRLKEVHAPLANFFASGVLRLGEKLGPLLWQLPPSFAFDSAQLTAFFELLPRDTEAAAKLARTHDARVKSPWTHTDQNRPLRHALEIRHPSFKCPQFVELLRQHHVALVVADTAGKWPLLEDVTADFVYVRLHGDQQLYVSGYTPLALDRWAEKARRWFAGDNSPESDRLASPAPQRPEGRDVFVYFDNDVKSQAPFDAQSLAYRLGIGPEASPAPAPHTIAEEPRTSSQWPWTRRKSDAPRRAQQSVAPSNSA